MRGIRAVAVVPVMCGVTLIAGCGPSSTTAASSTSGTATATSTSTTTSAAPGASDSGSSASTGTSGSASGSDTTASCPTSNTRSFAKTRFVTDIGLTAGTFHRYLWKPYQAGTFHKGATGRLKAILKGGATVALDLKLLSNAKKNVQANPTLCKVLYTPISNAADEMSKVKSGITSGDFSSLTALESAFSNIEKKSGSNGAPITESTDESQASNG